MYIPLTSFDRLMRSSRLKLQPGWYVSNGGRVSHFLLYSSSQRWGEMGMGMCKLVWKPTGLEMLRFLCFFRPPPPQQHVFCIILWILFGYLYIQRGALEESKVIRINRLEPWMTLPNLMAIHPVDAVLFHQMFRWRNSWCLHNIPWQSVKSGTKWWTNLMINIPFPRG